MPEGILTALSDLVRSMNCYYSNLFEGHDTHPIDIERALKEDYNSDAKKRNLQLEAWREMSIPINNTLPIVTYHDAMTWMGAAISAKKHSLPSLNSS